MLEKIQAWAKQLKRKVFVLYFAYKDHRTPWYAKLAAVCVVAYAFSPIDLIPDFIPVLGYLDDVILVPLGVWFALKLIPAKIVQECVVKAEERAGAGKPKNWFVGGLIIAIWIAGLTAAAVIAYRYFLAS